MTEEQWLACTDPAEMLVVLKGCGGQNRKVRFFVIACLVRSVKACEEPANGQAEAQVRKFFEGQLAATDLYGAAGEASRHAATLAADRSGFSPSHPGWWDVQQLELADQAEILRDLVGNPFREVAVQATWHTPAVAELVSHIDRNGAVDLMPALGAALSDAGCKDPQVLEHCRSTDHVAGCWLIDGLLRGATT